MSRASRASRGKRKPGSGRRSDGVVIRGSDEPCRCPECSGDEIDPEQMLAELVDGAADLADCEDPLEAELAGALFVAMATAEGDDPARSFAETFVPAAEARGNDAALIVLTAIGAAASGGPDPVHKAATAAAHRLAATGVPVPAWSQQLEQPPEAGPFMRLHDAEGTMSVLVGSFRRAEHQHAVVVFVNHEDCGAADDIAILNAAHVSDAVRDIRPRPIPGARAGNGRPRPTTAAGSGATGNWAKPLVGVPDA